MHVHATIHRTLPTDVSFAKNCRTITCDFVLKHDEGADGFDSARHQVLRLCTLSGGNSNNVSSHALDSGSHVALLFSVRSVPSLEPGDYRR